MSAITEAVEQLKVRLTEIEQQTAPLLEEAAQLREAIAKLEDLYGAPPTHAAPKSRTSRTTRSRASRSRSATKANGRAPRGENRRRILQAIHADAKTAGQVAAETGMNRGTVATTLSKLVTSGDAVKADRGYKAA